MTRADQAVIHFKNGMNCTQAVAEAFKDEAGLTAEELRRLGAGFGGGMYVGATCGAVTGAVLVLGARHARGNGDKAADRQRVGEETVEFARRFVASNGTLACKIPMGILRPREQELAEKKQAPIYHKSCVQLVHEAARLLDEGNAR